MIIELEKLITKYRLNIKGVAHFGAHLGQEIEIYKKLNIKIIHLFEPQKLIYDQLRNKCKNDENIQTYNYGLGSRNSISQLYLDTGDGQSSSILKPELHLTMNPDVQFNNTENIEIKRFDSLEIEDINFLNIDIQGYELEALKGSEGILSTIHCIYTEVNRDFVYKNCSLVGEIDDFLEQFGFIRVETKWWKGFYIWGDAFYVNRHIVEVSMVVFYKAKLLNYLYSLNIFFSFNKFLEMTVRKKIYRLKKRIKKYLHIEKN